MAKEPNIAQLVFTNNWESHDYSVNGKLITKMDHVHVKDPACEGLSKIKLRSCMVTETYSDMGTPGSATSMHYYIPIRVFGIEVEVPLDELIRKKPKMFFVDLNKIKTE